MLLFTPPRLLPEIPFVLRVGDLPEFKEGSDPIAISADGSTVVGVGRPDINTLSAYRWSAETGTVALGDLGGASHYSSPAGVSADGSVVGGCSTPDGPRPFRWTQKTGLVPLPVLKNTASNAYAAAVSADGNTVFGWSESLSINYPFRWTAATGSLPLDLAPGSKFQPSIHAASADGSVLVGDVERPSPDPKVIRTEGFRWSARDGFRTFSLLPGAQASSSINAVSADGCTIVGRSLDRNPIAAQAVRWTAETGLTRLGRLGEVPTVSEAEAVSADGAVIVGRSWGRGFLWTERTGMLDLQKLVAAQTPLPTDTYRLFPKAVAVTPDGIACIAAEWIDNQLHRRAYLIAIPVPH